MQFDKNPITDDLYAEATLGIEVEHFITSDKVGIYLMNRANVEKLNAMDGLANADPGDHKEIARLQWQYRLPDLLEAWLYEAIENGRVAEMNSRISDERP